jgi:hypothetical protein
LRASKVGAAQWNDKVTEINKIVITINVLMPVN